MIITRLMGGLGNQMFQYAAARALAEKRATQVRIDLSWFDSARLVDAPRHYELDRFSLKQNFIDPSRYALVAGQDSSLKIRLYGFTKGRTKPRVLLCKESGHGFGAQFFDQPNNVLLEGYWQSEKYFIGIRNLILTDFSFGTPATGKNEALLSDINSTNAVSIHVRRGDYANTKAAREIHGLMGLDYYAEAIKQINKRVPDIKFFVFSDDPVWCKQNLKVPGSAVYVDHNKDGAEDMRLMTACKHHIIANSTFSWWGAWLNPSEEKIVYAPKRWFANKDMDTRDILPESWEKL